VASYHFEAKIIGRSDGRSAIAAAAYRACARLTDPETGKVQDYTRKGGHVASFILAPDAAPEWATDRQQLWEAVHRKESRSNSQLARELTLALPHELTLDQSEAMLREWVEAELVGLGMVADVAIHDPRPRDHRAVQEDDDADDPEVEADDSPGNLHAHVMLTLRELDNARPDSWAKGKARSWNDTRLLEKWRESWADAQNRHLQRYGHAARVDHRSLEAQRADAEARGDEIAALVLSRPPEPRLGVIAGSLEARGVVTERGQALREAREDRAQIMALADAATAATAALEGAEREVETTDAIAQILAIPAPVPAPQPEEPHMTTDLTKRAVERQLKGMGLDQVEISIIGGDRPHVRTMTPAEIVTDLPRLKRANKSGCSIFIRGPRDQDHDLILLDDLNAFTPDRMKADGVTPAVVVETSPGSYQAWVKLGSPQPSEIRHEVARELTTRYGGDPGAVDPHQSGRLAGFTNPKPEHRTRIGSPFAKLHRFAGAVAERAAELIQVARAALAGRAEVARITAAPKPNADLVAWWRAGQEAVPEPRNLSAVDWHLTHVALATGRPPEDVAAALEAVSERKGRNGKNARDYAERTVAKAVAHRQDEPVPQDPFGDRPDHDPGPSLDMG
jgi:hypothetical protein